MPSFTLVCPLHEPIGSVQRIKHRTYRRSIQPGRREDVVLKVLKEILFSILNLRKQTRGADLAIKQCAAASASVCVRACVSQCCAQRTRMSRLLISPEVLDPSISCFTVNICLSTSSRSAAPLPPNPCVQNTRRLQITSCPGPPRRKRQLCCDCVIPLS